MELDLVFSFDVCRSYFKIHPYLLTTLHVSESEISRFLVYAYFYPRISQKDSRYFSLFRFVSFQNILHVSYPIEWSLHERVCLARRHNIFSSS